MYTTTTTSTTTHACCGLSAPCRPWDCTSFLKLSSKCATSPVSCCWDCGVGGRGVRKGVGAAERRGERQKGRWVIIRERGVSLKACGLSEAQEWTHFTAFPFFLSLTVFLPHRCTGLFWGSPSSSSLYIIHMEIEIAFCTLNGLRLSERQRERDREGRQREVETERKAKSRLNI